MYCLDHVCRTVDPSIVYIIDNQWYLRYHRCDTDRSNHHCEHCSSLNNIDDLWPCVIEWSFMGSWHVWRRVRIECWRFYLFLHNSRLSSSTMYRKLELGWSKYRYLQWTQPNTECHFSVCLESSVFLPCKFD